MKTVMRDDTAMSAKPAHRVQVPISGGELRRPEGQLNV